MLISASGLQIIGVGLSVPDKNVTNEEIWPDTSEWVKNNLGIQARRHISHGESLLDLCFKAATESLKSAGISALDIDCIIVATSTPDYINPSMAAIIHGMIGARQDCPAMDVQAVCAGFIYALGVAASFSNNNAGKHFLIIGADQFSKITDFDARDSVFFGDAAAAMIIKKTNSTNQFALELFADGAGWKDFHTHQDDRKFKHNGKAVTLKATEKIPEAILGLCKKIGLDHDKISHFFTHQPSKVVLDKIELSLGLAPNKIYRNLETRGNTASASIPSVFVDANKFKEIKQGEWVCFAAIGSGWVWGAAILEWVTNSD
jgi:3-oxoacyl-[acyl-carrier-protein] synthase-3